MDSQWNLLSWWSKCNNLLILKNRTYWPIYHIYEQYWKLGSKHIISPWSFSLEQNFATWQQNKRPGNFYKVFSEKKIPKIYHLKFSSTHCSQFCKYILGSSVRMTIPFYSCKNSFWIYMVMKSDCQNGYGVSLHVLS
jgi:hypothetical protein